MKLSVLLFVFLVVLMPMASALPNIIIDKIEPQPVEPGTDISIDFRLDNKNSNEIRNLKTALLYGFPFIFKSSSNDLSDISLCKGCEKESTYFLLIDPTAVSGDYNITIKSSSEGSSVSKEIEIRVRGKPNLIFSAETKYLENIVPNSKFSAVLSLENIGSGKARQIEIKPDSSSFTALGSSIKTLSSVDVGEAKQVSFDFIASSSLKADSYAIPFKISYLDDRGNKLNNTHDLGVRVINKGEINIQTIKIASDSGSSSIASGSPFTIVARMENVGEGDADNINAVISCPFNGPKKAFIGQLKKDEDAPAVFNLVSTASGVFECDLNVFYEDDTGKHELKESFNFTISPPDYSGSVLILVILILAALFAVRKRILKRK